MSKFHAKGSQAHQLRRRVDAFANPEGGLAFAHDLRETLVKMASCSLVGESLYYGDTTGQIARLVAAAASRWPEWTVKLAVYLRETLDLRSISQVVLAIASREAAARPFVRAAFDRVATRTDDLIEIGSLVKDDHHGIFENPPSVLRRRIRRRLEGLTEHEAIKYRRAGGLGLKHLVRIFHPRPADPTRNAVLRYALGRRLGEADLALLPEVAALRRLRAERNVALVRERRLPWELVLPMLGPSREVWEALGVSMPMMALLRNLRNLHESGALANPEVRARVLTVFRDADAVRASKQLPFRWFSAWRAMETLDPEVASAVGDALEVSTACLPRLAGTTAIWIDHSGSMSCCPLSRRSTLTPRDVADLLGAISHDLCEDSLVGAFADEAVTIELPPQGRILEHMRTLAGIDVGGATFAHEAIERMIALRRRVDRAIFLTDCVLWSPSREHVWSEDECFYSTWQRYRREVSPHARAYVWNLQPYECFVEPSGDESIVTLSGWSEGLLRYAVLDTQSTSAQVVEVDRIQL